MSKYHSLALWTCVATLSLPTISAAADVRKSSQTHIEQPSSFDMTVLDKAFHKLLTDTAFGYALCGNKPISLETVSCPQNLFPGTPNHKWAVIMSEFAGSWKKFQLEPIQAIDLSLAIPGLAHGIVGMKKMKFEKYLFIPILPMAFTRNSVPERPLAFK